MRKAINKSSCLQRAYCVSLVGFLIRCLFIIYGEWQDYKYEVGFTDVDYKVFTDAAQNVLQNETPYKQPTYRYSPLLALLLTPNIYLFNQFGKILFCLVDIIVGQQIWWFAQKCILVSEKNALIMQCLWIFNLPFVAVISARGNSDSLTVMLILNILQSAYSKNALACGAILGVAVHLRVFPIIYTPALLLQFGFLRMPRRENAAQILNLMFGSATTFFGLLYIFYQLYGFQFIQQAYLYHLQREDFKHNFSAYFYGAYLSVQDIGSLTLSPLIIAGALILYISHAFRDSLYVSFILITIIFVGFNKVITAQYFTWFFGLLPLLYSQVRIGVGVCFWLAMQLHWLYWGYGLEFLGQQVFLEVWLASVGFFIANISLVVVIVLTFKK